jgi:maleylacetate reductase
MIPKLYTIYNIQKQQRGSMTGIHPFQYSSHTQQVVFGAGILTHIQKTLSPYPWQRLMLCTSPHLVQNGQVHHLQTLLGDRLVTMFAETEAHVPQSQVEASLALAHQHQVDAVIGMGGGSAIGMAKAVAYELTAQRTETHSDPNEKCAVPTIAIPTTYAGSEMTPIFGVTRPQANGTTRKVTVNHPTIVPKVVIYDPELTVDLPPELTATTGINALAHCIEAIYSITRNPMSTASALLGIRYLKAYLVRSFQNPTNIEARSGVLIGAHMAGKSLASVEIGVHHGTCHVLGGTAGVPHGIANCIILPHAIRFNADTVGDLIALAGESLGIERGKHTEQELAEATAQAIYDLIAEFGVPQRLRDVNVPESLLPTLAETMLKSKAVQNNPKPVKNVETAMTILQAAW